MKRIQLSRRRRLPNGARSVARPGKWGNPYIVGIDGTQEECVRLFAAHVAAMPEDTRRTWLLPLREAPALACWCPVGTPCHADILIGYLSTQE